MNGLDCRWNGAADEPEQRQTRWQTQKTCVCRGRFAPRRLLRPAADMGAAWDVQR